MKKLLLVLLMSVAGYNSIQAQEIYEEVKRMARENVESPSSSQFVKDINNFKLAALQYMGMNMREKSPDSPATVLDNLAYAMHNYVSLYIETLVSVKDQPKKYKEEVMKAFIDTTLETPLFGDEDRATVLSFMDAKAVTPFSLDTNWAKALETIQEKLKKLSKK